MNHSMPMANRRILIIDDNRAIHSDFKKILCPATGATTDLDQAETELFGKLASPGGPAGFHVDFTVQGQEGLALVKQAAAGHQPYSVAFVDMRMPPGWDGIETTAKIWEVAPDTEIVICTAYSDYSWEAMVERLGISDRMVILKKPFDNVEVVQLTHALTEKWRLRQESKLKLDQMSAMVAERTRELQVANEKLRHEMVEREKTQEALRQSQKMEALGQLAGGIAHDFNNLLTIIRGYVDFLVSEGKHNEDSVIALQEIGDAADRAAKLTSQILTFSRKKRMHPQCMDLNTVLFRLGTMLKRLIGENIVLQLDCSNTPLLANVDPVMMEQAILNLAMNARDAMPKGGQLTIRACEIHIDEAHVRNNPRSRAGHFAHVQVIDNGTGISPAALPHVFDPFFTTKPPGKGTGLGLATVYGIMQQHKGWVEVESQPGAGAKFSLFLPLTSTQASPKAEPLPKFEIQGGTETILLVEDDPTVHRMTCNFLKRHGYTVYEANTGQEALAVWKKHAGEIDLLLTDIVIPGSVSGRELAQILKAQHNGLVVIFTTGYSPDSLNTETPLEEGKNFLAKPYSPEKLAHVVRNNLDKRAKSITPLAPVSKV